jgi:hypothetical protein
MSAVILFVTAGMRTGRDRLRETKATAESADNENQAEQYWHKAPHLI